MYVNNIQYKIKITLKNMRCIEDFPDQSRKGWSFFIHLIIYLFILGNNIETWETMLVVWLCFIIVYQKLYII